MAIDWIEFALNVIGGAMAFLCLFEGVLRMGVRGVRRGPLLTALLGLTFFAAYGAFAWWRYSDINETLAMRYTKPPAAQAAPASVDAARARASFVASGLLVNYVERGEKKLFSPNQDDVRRRERMVATSTLQAATAQASLLEALLWAIVAVVAAVSGFLFSREKPPVA